jgi:enamine deaminase RidA (YjgF/YER057c/UK114 family)
VALDAGGNLVGKGDARAQTEQIHANLRAIMAANGGTLRDIVKLTTFVTDMSDRMKMADLRKRDFSENPPASTLVEVSRLASADWLVEVEAVAVVRA